MKVAIVLGSMSDYHIGEKTIKRLEAFNIDYELRIISAHRALGDLQEFVSTFEEKNIGVCIAMAGKAAHLPGVIAGMTTVPVIGVPIFSTATSGIDSLLSIVQMPSGVPVATVAIDGGENAAILSAQILALSDPKLKDKLLSHKDEMVDKVRQQNNKMK